MVVSKIHRKNQSSIVRVAVAAAMIFIIYALNEERTRLARSVAASSTTISTDSTTTETAASQERLASTENSLLSETSRFIETSGTAEASRSAAANIERSTSSTGDIHPVQSLDAQVRAFDTALLGAADPPCLPFIFYDKPVKTGSTAVTEALAKYIESVGDPEAVCLTLESCSAMAIDTCNGQRERSHLIQHVNITSPVTSCLRQKGYYHVTSIREPKQRIISAWKYSRRKKESHYGIPWDASFEDFLKVFPKCAMFHYFDRKKHGCGSVEEVTVRAKEIVGRMDEIIDLYQEPISDVHRRISPYIARVNAASDGKSESSDLHVPDELVQYEYILYNMMQEKRASLAKNPRRRFCPKAER